MQLLHSEKSAILIALTQTIKLDDGRMEERTAQLMNLQNTFGVSMAEMRMHIARGADFCLTLQQMTDEKKLFLFQNLCAFLIGKDGKFSPEAQEILLTVSRAAYMSNQLMQRGLNLFRQIAENQ